MKKAFNCLLLIRIFYNVKKVFQYLYNVAYLRRNLFEYGKLILIEKLRTHKLIKNDLSQFAKKKTEETLINDDIACSLKNILYLYMKKETTTYEADKPLKVIVTS